MKICTLSSIPNITKYTLKTLLFLFITIFSIGCNNNIELAMERGIQYYEWNMIEKAVLEFKYVIHSLDITSKKLDYRKIKLLSRAHHNLAVAYAKKKWYEDAEKEARNAFELLPTDNNRRVLELIKTKQTQQTGKDPKKVDT